MFHPDYVYRPMPEEQRKRLSEAHRRRLGNLEGHRCVYGVQVPETIWREVQKRAARIAGHGKASKADMRFFVRILIVMVEEGR